jgi:hypothetical protein
MCCGMSCTWQSHYQDCKCACCCHCPSYCCCVGVGRSSSSGAGGSSSSRARASSAPRERQRPQSAPWRPSSPPKAGAAFCVLSHVGRNYVPDPVKEAKVRRQQLSL